MGDILPELRRLWLLVVTCSVLAIGCVSFDHGEPPLGPDEPDLGDKADDPTDDAQDPCLCDSDACFEQWIRDAGHCGECVVFACDYGDVHACAQCPGDFDPGPLPKGPQQDLEGGMDVGPQRPL